MANVGADGGGISAREEWARGWTLVLAASVGFSFFSLMLSGTGLFMDPLEKAFHWKRTLISSGVTIATITTALLSPFFGMLVDRYGSRRVALPGVMLTMISVSSFAAINGTPEQWWALWLCFGIVAAGIKSTVWNAAVLGVFSRSKGLALGLTMTGTAVAQMLVPIIGNQLIEAFGWRAAYVWLGLGWGSITLILCLLFFYDAHDIKAARAARFPAEAQQAAGVLQGLSGHEALRDSALWRIGISNFTVMALTMGLAQHLFPILTDSGISRGKAALLTGLLTGISGIVGKLVTGVLPDRFRPNWIGGITLGVAAVSFTLLSFGLHSPALVMLAMVVNGYAAGTKTQITGYLTASYGGMKNFGAIYGVMAALMALASGLGPLLAAWIYDTTGGYGPFLIAGAVGCALSGLMIISMPAYPVWAKRDEEEVFA